MRVGNMLALALMAPSLGCQALADPGIDYVGCLPARNGKYVERFQRMDPQSARDHCWKTDNLRVDGAYIEDQDPSGDLIIHPIAGQWSATAQAPFFFQTVTGNFLAVTRAEAVSGLTDGDHCGPQSFKAGLAVRTGDGSRWSTLLVQPDLDMMPDTVKCADNAEPLPAARVSTDSFGFRAPATITEPGVGVDAEAYIAVCRADDQLSFFRQAEAKRSSESAGANFKAVFPALTVGFGPLDVGVTATADVADKNLAEGHFTWLVLTDHSGARRVADSCPGMLDEFEFPEDDSL